MMFQYKRGVIAMRNEEAISHLLYFVSSNKLLGLGHAELDSASKLSHSPQSK
jgi:hypothetical protein